MSARRGIGLETEFGIIDADDPQANPIVLSTEVVDAYGGRGSAAGGAGAIRCSCNPFAGHRMRNWHCREPRMLC